MQLRSVAETRPAVDAPDPFGQDLYVLCAETAYQVQYSILAKLKLMGFTIVTCSNWFASLLTLV